MEDEIELRELIEILIKKKKTIAVFTLGAILLAMVYSFIILKPTYESKMVLMTSAIGNTVPVQDDKTILMTSDAVDADLPKFNSARVDSILDEMSKNSYMDMEAYRQEIKSPSVLSKTIEDLNLEDKYNIDSLANKINFETIKDTQLMTIKMENTDPQEAAAIVNQLGNNFIESLINKNREKTEIIFSYVETQMEIGKTKYEESLSEQKEILSKPRGAKELGLELDSSFNQITEYKARLNDLEIQREGLTSALAESKASGGNTALNARVNLAEIHGQINSIESQIENIGSHIGKLQVEYQDKEYEANIVRQKTERAKSTYEYFLSKYEELKITETAKMGELNINIISKAYPATTPVGPRKMLNLAIATVLGLMIGVFAAFFKEYWDSGSKKEENPGGDEVV